MQVQTIGFFSEGMRLAGDLFLPDDQPTLWNGVYDTGGINDRRRTIYFGNNGRYDNSERDVAAVGRNANHAASSPGNTCDPPGRSSDHFPGNGNSHRRRFYSYSYGLLQRAADNRRTVSVPCSQCGDGIPLTVGCPFEV